MRCARLILKAATTVSSPEKGENYYNFTTYHKGAAPVARGKLNVKRLSRQLLEKGPSMSAGDRLPLESTFRHEPGDPYEHVKIFRRDMADGRSAPQLSVDVPLKKLSDMFCDYGMRRCKLCNETYIQWFSHEKHVPHAGRMGMAVELLRAHCGKPEDIVEMWWHRLDTSTQFNRIRSLSHRDSHVRKRRIQYLIQFLVDRGVIAETFSLNSSDAHSAGRSYEFERLEFIGDNVVKYVLNDRLSCCFPPSEGGIRGRLGYFQFVMDGNEGLARTYDYLEFQRFSKSDRVVSKFKSDVVETIFGELQFYLLSTVQAYSTEEYPLPFSHGSYTLRALAEHTMEELAHIFFIHHVEAVLGCVQRIVRENQLHFVNADPVSQDTVKEETKSPNKSALSSTRIPFSTTAASQITESTILTSVQRSIDFTGTPAPREEEGSKKKVSLSIGEEHKGEPSDRLFRPVPSAVHVLDSKELFTVKELKTKGLVEELV